MVRIEGINAWKCGKVGTSPRGMFRGGGCLLAAFAVSAWRYRLEEAGLGPCLLLGPGPVRFPTPDAVPSFAPTDRFSDPALWFRAVSMASNGAGPRSRQPCPTLRRPGFKAQLFRQFYLLLKCNMQRGNSHILSVQLNEFSYSCSQAPDLERALTGSPRIRFQYCPPGVTTVWAAGCRSSWFCASFQGTHMVYLFSFFFLTGLLGSALRSVCIVTCTKLGLLQIALSLIYSCFFLSFSPLANF